LGRRFGAHIRASEEHEPSGRQENDLKIVPLGTSSGQPTRERGVSALAAFVGSPKRWTLIDCGEGTLRAIAQAAELPRLDAQGAPTGETWRLRLADLGAICLTHAHGDHCFGIFGLLGGLESAGRRSPLKIVAPPQVREMVQVALKCVHMELPFAIDWAEPQDGLRVDLGEGLSCLCVAMAHRAPSHGYLFESRRERAELDPSVLRAAGCVKESDFGRAVAQLKRGEAFDAPDGSKVLPSQALRFEVEIESLFVGGDNMEPERVARAAAGALAWVHEATYSQADWENGGAGQKWGHSSARMIGDAARQGAPKALVLTHFSPRYGDGSQGIEGLVAEAAQAFGGPVHAAREGVALYFEPLREPMPKPKGPKA
jgi:ribonuclease Z